MTSSKLISFADDTRVYNQISDTEDCDSLQRDLNSVYKWTSDNNMFFNAKKFHYLPLSASQASNKGNVYINPSMDIIPQSTDVPDLCIIMSKDCSFDSHISSLSRKCKNLAGWILRSFVSRDKLTMLTLFKSLVISRLDYASQLWSPHKISQKTVILDASKAFDRLNYWLLFDKLIKKHVPLFIIKLLCFWYTSQKMFVRWGATTSTQFTVSNGVKQGGLISPILFNVYMDDLSIALNSSGIGGYLGAAFLNHLCYADDLCLISLSSNGMQQLLNICQNYATNHQLLYNGAKSFSLCFKDNTIKIKQVIGHDIEQVMI